MKRLLVLGVFLGMGAAASAGFSFDKDVDDPKLRIVDSGGTGSVSVVAGYSESLIIDWGYWAQIHPPLRLLEYLGLFDMSTMGRADLGMMNLWLLGVTGDRPAGVVADISVNGIVGWGDLDLGQGIAVLLDSDTSDQIDIAYAIPEPLTLSLLGVGALLLRRRQ